jgi:hypothetical protein
VNVETGQTYIGADEITAARERDDRRREALELFAMRQRTIGQRAEQVQEVGAHA